MNYSMQGSDGKSYGPVPADTIRAWFREGRANLQTRLAPEGSQDWQPLGTLPEFADLSTAGAPPPPPPMPHSAPPPAPFPRPAPAAVPATSCGMATASLVCGILSFVACGLFTGIPAIICGHKAKGKIARSGGTLTGDGAATAGLVMGYVSLAFTLLVIPLLAAIAIPSFIKARDTAQANYCVNNLRQLDGAKE